VSLLSLVARRRWCSLAELQGSEAGSSAFASPFAGCCCRGLAPAVAAAAAPAAALASALTFCTNAAMRALPEACCSSDALWALLSAAASHHATKHREHTREAHHRCAALKALRSFALSYTRSASARSNAKRLTSDDHAPQHLASQRHFLRV